jgi:hypothetical protein
MSPVTTWCSVDALPMDAPDHAEVDTEDVPACFAKYWAQHKPTDGKDEL